MDHEVLELIEDALDSTLRELQCAQARSPRKTPNGEALTYWLADDCTSRSADILDLTEIVSSPVAVSLRAQLHALGWLLFRQVGTTQDMQQVAEWVAALDVSAYEFRAGALHGAFAGVGAGDDVWAG